MPPSWKKSGQKWRSWIAMSTWWLTRPVSSMISAFPDTQYRRGRNSPMTLRHSSSVTFSPPAAMLNHVLEPGEGGDEHGLLAQQRVVQTEGSGLVHQGRGLL